MLSQLRTIKRYTVVLMIVWTLLILISLGWFYLHQKNNVYEIARAEARVAFQKDTLYRKWAAEHGGVYAPATQYTAPNPDLAHISERDLTTPSGRLLTLINPAYMTRQVFELAAQEKDFVKGHITSLNPIRPENAPDSWERNALQAFESGTKEVSGIQQLNGETYMRLMRPFITDEACLKCHAAQGYQRGDIRGGISISVPMSIFSPSSDHLLKDAALTLATLWGLGIGMIFFGSRKLGQNATVLHAQTVRLEHEVAERKIAQEQLQEQAAILEEEIAERQQAQERLANIMREKQVILDFAPVGITLIIDRKMVWINRKFEELLACTRENVVGKNPTMFYPTVEAYEQFGHDAYPLIARGEEYETTRELQRCDGKLFWAHLIGRAIDPNDMSQGIIWISEDITERRSIEAQLQQAQKMESVGRLAGGVAHDFNNLLTVILGHEELARMKLASSSTAIADDLTEIRKAAEKSAGLTKQLLAFARKQVVQPKLLNLNDTVADILKMLRRLIGEDIDLAWHPGSKLWPIMIDPSQVDQILANLCVNSRDAISDVGKVIIETHNRTFDDEHCANNAGYLPGEYVMLAVSDNGCGMDKETAAHVFEPFFTTKGPGEGTGLGLATVYGIVKQNNGFISIYSEPGSGTTFKIYLPRHDAVASLASAAELPPSPAPAHETILLVEDDASIQELTAQLLESQGYRVMKAGTPHEAMEITDKFKDEIQLLMTDMVMPGMNGRELARNLTTQYPTMKCLYTSGYTASVIAHHGVLDKEVHFIAKPFSLANLAAKVREALDA